MNKHVGTGEKLACRIFNIDFDEQRARGSVDRIRCPHELAPESFPGIFVERQIGRCPDASRRSVYLGNWYVDTQLVDGRHVKQLLWLRASACIDQIPHIRIALRDDPVERSINPLE